MVQILPLAHTAVGEVPELLEFLSQAGISLAPHVAAALVTDLASDIEAVLEVARALTPSQLSGHSALPDPLPLMPGLRARIGAAGDELDAEDRAGLLAAAICVEDRTDVLLEQQHVTMSELIASRRGTHLLFVAGHFSFVDPRMRIWVHGSATLAERTNAHIEMQRAYTAMGDMDKAIWHESLATLEGDNLLVPSLLRLSRKANAANNAVWAHAIAREAASHAVGAELFQAQLCAGEAALNLGQVGDAATWLGGALSSPDVLVAARALPAFIHAESLLAGEAPTVALARYSEAFLSRAQALDAAGFATVARQVAKATGLAAGLCAARGMLEEAEGLLTMAERLVEVHKIDGLPLCAARLWCANFGGPTIEPEYACRCRGCLDGLPDNSGARVVMEALTLGLDDDPYAGLRLLKEGPEAGRSMTVSNRGGGLQWAPTPLGLAYGAVVAALLQLWLGDVSRAAAELGRAAASVPVGLPFFGLGVIVARRLDVLTTGQVGTVAHAMEASYPAGSSAFIRTGDLMDRTLSAYLDGRIEEASTLGRLAAERSLRGAASPLHVPGFDEMTPHQSEAGSAGARVHDDGINGPQMPSGHRRASSARMALCATSASRFAKDYEYAERVSVTLRSQYERARTEFVIGRTCLEHGTPGVAREHLVVAADLFREIGALAWLRCVENTLSNMPEPPSHLDAPTLEPDIPTETVTISAAAAPRVAAGSKEALAHSSGPQGGSLASAKSVNVRGDGPLQRFRQAWGEQLTEREMEVAMLVVDGASNRQVAAQLHVSVRTVEVHVGRIFAKLSVRSRVELSVLAHRMGSEWIPACT
ncbi:helix-turn-helix transcriptional regulator [Arthrobacter sp. lap29]|uniref:response regulator transcription factor n=1 Tax=Arthrobacter sp. lap29 TaxID=3056122 RepID=UPI0028F72E08|nr:helix-turn-helix transcriptional regulator [Arthrobacter sp. lap29]